MSAYVAQARYIVPNMLNPWFGSAHTTLTHATHHMPTYIVAVRPNIMFMLVGSSLGRDHICSVTSLSEPHTDGETGCIFCHDRSYVRPFACSNLTFHYHVYVSCALTYRFAIWIQPQGDFLNQWILTQDDLLNLQRSEPTGFSVEEKERELFVLQRQQNKRKKD